MVGVADDGQQRVHDQRHHGGARADAAQERQRDQKNKLQVPSIHRWEHSTDSGMYGGYRARRGDGDGDFHVRAWPDDKGRIMVIATHNSDNGDGWEREGENRVYFETFSETRAYPLGINIIFYVMTH